VAQLFLVRSIPTVSDKLSASSLIGLVAGYLLSATGILVVNLFAQANQPDISIVRSVTAASAVFSAGSAIALLLRRRLALPLTKVYFWLQLIMSTSLLCLVIFGFIGRDYNGMSVLGLTINMLFAASFILLLRRSDVHALFSHDTTQKI
jgi:hypothetical protein